MRSGKISGPFCLIRANELNKSTHRNGLHLNICPVNLFKLATCQGFQLRFLPENKMIRGITNKPPLKNDAICKLGKPGRCNMQNVARSATETKISTANDYRAFDKTNFLVSSARYLQRKIHARTRVRQKKQLNLICMNTLATKGNWNIAKGKLKQKFAQLTDDDLQFEEGKEDELVGRILKRTGQAREEIERAVKECCAAQGKPGWPMK
jgi:uncharacterized protein YjbJ (UPF0337 family)